MSKQSVGQYRVGNTFNPSGDDAVTELKAKAAAFIDHCDHLRRGLSMDRNLDREREALFDRAMRECESAAMWAVKAETKRARE